MCPGAWLRLFSCAAARLGRHIVGSCDDTSLSSTTHPHSACGFGRHGAGAPVVLGDCLFVAALILGALALWYMREVGSGAAMRTPRCWMRARIAIKHSGNATAMPRSNRCGGHRGAALRRVPTIALDSPSTEPTFDSRARAN